MAGIVSITLSDDRQARFSREGFRRIYRLKLQVITTGPTISELDILADPRMPIIGRSFYEYNGWVDAGAICTDIDCKPLDRDLRTVWLCEVTYDSAGSNFSQSSGGGSGSSPQSTNPLFDRPSVSWSTQIRPVVIWKSLDNKPFATSAGEPLADGYQLSVPLRSLTIVRNEPTFDAFDTWTYEDTTNARRFQRQNRGEALCESIDANDGARDGVPYKQVTYKFLFASDHLAYFLDKGSFYLEPLPTGQAGPRTKKSFTSATGQAIKEGFLDGNGGKAANGAQPRFVSFIVRDETDFDELDLPDPA